MIPALICIAIVTLAVIVFLFRRNRSGSRVSGVRSARLGDLRPGQLVCYETKQRGWKSLRIARFVTFDGSGRAVIRQGNEILRRQARRLIPF